VNSANGRCLWTNGTVNLDSLVFAPPSLLDLLRVPTDVLKSLFVEPKDGLFLVVALAILCTAIRMFDPIVGFIWELFSIKGRVAFGYCAITVPDLKSSTTFGTGLMPWVS